VLIRFEVSNFRSILDPAELSLVAVDQDRPEARHMDNLGESLLPVAAIFGPNASGKSNVIAALIWLRDAVQESLRFWDDEIPVEPFAFSSDSGRTSDFTIEYVIDGIRFEYVLELDRDAVRYEGLFHYPEKKRRRIFEREGFELKLQRGLGGLSGTRELLTSRTLVLSVARRFDEPLVSRFANNILEIRALGLEVSAARLLPRVGVGSSRPTFSWFEDGIENDRTRALAMLRMADLGIEDVVIDDADSSRSRSKIRLVHRTAGDPVQLNFSAESAGTRTWFALIGPVLTALDEGSVLLFDELDASLHPALSGHLLRLFHDPETNPKGAQLIFTSHDTSLLNHLNRDEVWLTEKTAQGVTRLGALAEFAGERVRKSKNLEQAYLHGRFGALPDVDRTEILRALGLIG
jgi:uncharacterized protein